MRTFLLLSAIFWAGTSFAGNSPQLRAFVEPLAEGELANAENKSGIIVGDQYLMIYRLRNGDELGRQVPAVWVTKRGFKWKTCLIAESHLLESTVQAADVSNGELIATFVRDGNAVPLNVRLRLIVRDDIGLVFFEGVGLETQQTGPRQAGPAAIIAPPSPKP